MRWLPFLSRLTFICNLFFLLSLAIQLARWSSEKEIELTFVFITYYFAVFLNPIVFACYLLFYFLNKSKLKTVPTWLMIANTLFLIFQIFYIVHLNGR